MKKEIGKIIRKIKEVVENQDFINAHKKKSKDFTRKVKLGFPDVINFVLGKTGNTLGLEQMKFSQKSGIEVSPSAITQARAKVKYTAFKSLLIETSKTIEPKNLYKGYRVTSFDGMQGELPRTKELMEKYRPTSVSEYPMFHALAEYDVLNCIYTNAIFASAPANERELVCQLLEKHDYPKEEIFLLDRGFPGIEVIQQLEQNSQKYIMRISTSFLRETNEFIKSKSVDKVIYVEYDKRRKSTSRSSFTGDEFAFTLRCVKIDLPNGKYEVLITNLLKEEMSRSEIGDLYNLRWRIETAFLDLKYAVHVEDFLGKKEELIKQEFFASLIQANVSMLFMEVANNIVVSKKKKLRC